MSFDLIIFDCDGTLVDSEIIHNQSISDLLTGMGHSRFDLAYTLEHFVGKGMEEVFRHLEGEIGHPLPAGFLPDYVRMVEQRMESSLKVIDGVHDVLAGLPEKIKKCVASNGEMSNVTTAIRVTGLDTYFPSNLIFTKDMVARAKPAPDLFLHAAAKTGVLPSRAVVIEDSVTGVIAGKAAGMVVIGLTAVCHDKNDHEAALRAAGADHVIDRFSHVTNLVTP